MKRLKIGLLLATAALLSSLSACGQGGGTAGSEAKDGASLLASRCSACHGADRTRQVKKNREEWGATVTRMISKGAKLSAEEKVILIDYLVKTSGQ